MYRGTNICSHPPRTDSNGSTSWGARIRTRILGPKPSVLPVRRLPRTDQSRARRRYYDASGVRAHGRHPRRRRRNAHAFLAAQGPAPAVRAPADPVAGRRGAGGRRREGRRGRQPEAAARGPAARGRRASRSRRSRTAPAARSRPPAAHIDADATVVVINGDVPLITAEAIAAARRGARGERRGGHDGHDGARRPRRATGAWSATREGNVERVVEAKAEGDATPEQLAIREVNTGIYAFDGASLLAALAQLDTDNAQGELYLPDVLPEARARPARRSRAHLITDPTLTLGVNDRVELAAGPQARPAAHPRGATPRNGVTIVDPDSTLIDVGVTIGRDTVVEPGTILKRRHDDRRGLRDRPAHDDDRLDARRRRERPALLPRPAPGRGLRHDRPVRLPAPRRPPAPERQGGRVRGDQELDHRQGHEGPAPVLHRRHRHRREHEHRRRQHHRQLRRARTSTGRRSAPTSGRAWTPRSSRRSKSAMARTPRAGSVITEDVPANALGIARARQKNIADYAERRKS